MKAFLKRNINNVADMIKDGIESDDPFSILIEAQSVLAHARELVDRREKMIKEIKEEISKKIAKARERLRLESIEYSRKHNTPIFDQPLVTVERHKIVRKTIKKYVKKNSNWSRLGFFPQLKITHFECANYNCKNGMNGTLIPDNVVEDCKININNFDVLCPECAKNDELMSPKDSVAELWEELNGDKD